MNESASGPRPPRRFEFDDRSGGVGQSNWGQQAPSDMANSTLRAFDAIVSARRAELVSRTFPAFGQHAQFVTFPNFPSAQHALPPRVPVQSAAFGHPSGYFLIVDNCNSWHAGQSVANMPGAAHFGGGPAAYASHPIVPPFAGGSLPFRPAADANLGLGGSNPPSARMPDSGSASARSTASAALSPAPLAHVSQQAGFGAPPSSASSSRLNSARSGSPNPRQFAAPLSGGSGPRSPPLKAPGPPFAPGTAPGSAAGSAAGNSPPGMVGGSGGEAPPSHRISGSGGGGGNITVATNPHMAAVRMERKLLQQHQEEKAVGELPGSTMTTTTARRPSSAVPSLGNAPAMVGLEGAAAVRASVAFELPASVAAVVRHALVTASLITSEGCIIAPILNRILEDAGMLPAFAGQPVEPAVAALPFVATGIVHATGETWFKLRPERPAAFAYARNDSAGARVVPLRGGPVTQPDLSGGKGVATGQSSGAPDVASTKAPLSNAGAGAQLASESGVETTPGGKKRVATTATASGASPGPVAGATSVGSRTPQPSRGVAAGSSPGASGPLPSVSVQMRAWQEGKPDSIVVDCILGILGARRGTWFTATQLHTSVLAAVKKADGGRAGGGGDASPGSPTRWVPHIQQIERLLASRGVEKRATGPGGVKAFYRLPPPHGAAGKAGDSGVSTPATPAEREGRSFEEEFPALGASGSAAAAGARVHMSSASPPLAAENGSGSREGRLAAEAINPAFTASPSLVPAPLIEASPVCSPPGSGPLAASASPGAGLPLPLGELSLGQPRSSYVSRHRFARDEEETELPHFD